MIEGLMPYPEYDNSSLPWLNQKPRHWRTARNGNLFQQRNDTRHPELPILEVSLRTGVRVRNFNGTKRKQVMSDAAKYKRAAKGDIAYNMMRMWQGAVGVAPTDGLVSPAYVVARSLPGVCAPYFTTLFRCGVYMGEIDAASRGIVKDRNRLYWDQFKQMQSLVPPHEEQEAIVRFLAHANHKIDGFMRAKRKLIGLLNEQKQAIIHQAVTRGLDPSVPLKPSGIPWLGDIPKHWEVWPFVRCCVERSDYRGATPEKVESGVFLVTAKNIRKGWIDYETSKEYVRADDYSRIMRRGLPKIGDVLFTMEAPLGHVALVDKEEVALAQRIIRFRLDPKLLFPQFAMFAMNSPYFQHQLVVRATGSTAQGIKASKLPQLMIVMPPVREQEAILADLPASLNPLDNAIARTEREIALMQEYRTRLTADLVTGKLDVREAASKLPDVVDLSPAQTTEDADETEEAMEEEA